MWRKRARLPQATTLRGQSKRWRSTSKRVCRFSDLVGAQCPNIAVPIWILKEKAEGRELPRGGFRKPEAEPPWGASRRGDRRRRDRAGRLLAAGGHTDDRAGRSNCRCGRAGRESHGGWC